MEIYKGIKNGPGQVDLCDGFHKQRGKDGLFFQDKNQNNNFPIALSGVAQCRVAAHTPKG